MDPRDDDIDINFFDDEPATTESASSRVRLPRRGGQGTGMPRRPSTPSRTGTPILRLVAAVVVALVLLLVFALLINSCASTSKHSTYAHYMQRVGVVAASSANDGHQVASALTLPLKPAALADKLDGIANQERQNVVAAQRLGAPGRLRTQNTQLVEALQLRVNGTQHLADTFRATAGSKSSADATLLLQQANRLLASDVVYDDLFRGPARQVMQDQSVLGVPVPESHYVTNQDQLTKTYWSLVLQRLRGGSSATGGSSAGAIHGTNIASTTVEPGGKTLTDQLNTINSSPSLAFVVTVHNGGTAQEVRIAVTLTIQKSPKSIVRTQTIPVINPGQDTSVRFPMGDVSLPFGLTSHVKVDVATVPHEKDATNNTATYPAVFSLG